MYVCIFPVKDWFLSGPYSIFPHVAFSQCGIVRSRLVSTATELWTPKMSALQGREGRGLHFLAQLPPHGRGLCCSHYSTTAPLSLWRVKAFHFVLLFAFQLIYSQNLTLGRATRLDGSLMLRSFLFFQALCSERCCPGVCFLKIISVNRIALAYMQNL